MTALESARSPEDDEIARIHEARADVAALKDLAREHGWTVTDPDVRIYPSGWSAVRGAVGVKVWTDVASTFGGAEVSAPLIGSRLVRDLSDVVAVRTALAAAPGDEGAP